MDEIQTEEPKSLSRERLAVMSKEEVCDFFGFEPKENPDDWDLDDGWL